MADQEQEVNYQSTWGSTSEYKAEVEKKLKAQAEKDKTKNTSNPPTKSATSGA